MGYWIIDGKRMTDEEFEQYQQREEEAEERARQEISARVKKLGEEYAALRSLLKENPDVGYEVTDGEAEDAEIYERLRKNLERADQAPRCRWVKQDGTGCGSPQMRKHIYCFAHKQMMEARALALRLPALEDANAIQIAIMRVQTALIDQTISERAAGLLLYSLQIAAANIGKTTFGQAEDGEMVTEVVDEKEALSEKAVSSQHSAISQNPKPLTAKDAEGAKEEEGLPLISMDDADRKSVSSILPEEEIPGVPPARVAREVYAKLG